MRRFVVAGVLVGLVGLAAPLWAGPDWLMRPVPPLPPIGLPLAPTGLPPATPAGGDHALEQGSNSDGSPKPADPAVRRRHRTIPGAPLLVVPVPVLGGPVEAAAPRDEAPAVPAPHTGVLWLDLTPAADAQVFVDGFYIGTAADYASGLELQPGPHRVEVRAPGYQPSGFDVRIEADRVITYRGALAPVETPASVAGSRPAQPTVPAAPPSVLYVIPGCYAGNVPPERASLPAGCDPARMTRMPH